MNKPHSFQIFGQVCDTNDITILIQCHFKSMAMRSRQHL